MAKGKTGALIAVGAAIALLAFSGGKKSKGKGSGNGNGKKPRKPGRDRDREPEEEEEENGGGFRPDPRPLDPTDQPADPCAPSGEIFSAAAFDDPRWIIFACEAWQEWMPGEGGAENATELAIGIAWRFHPETQINCWPPTAASLASAHAVWTIYLEWSVNAWEGAEEAEMDLCDWLNDPDEEPDNPPNFPPDEAMKTCWYNNRKYDAELFRHQGKEVVEELVALGFPMPGNNYRDALASAEGAASIRAFQEYAYDNVLPKKPSQGYPPPNAWDTQNTGDTDNNGKLMEYSDWVDGVMGACTLHMLKKAREMRLAGQWNYPNPS